MHLQRYYAALFVLFFGLLVSFQVGYGQTGKKDTVFSLTQPGNGPYQCCHTFIVTNRHSQPTTISRFRIRILSDGGSFIQGQAGSPINWNVFLSTREVEWISSTSAAEIDSGESLSSFRACLRDTGVYKLRWETYGTDGLLSFDTLTFICGPRNNCDQAFFTAVPSSTRCGFDIDVLNENGAQKTVNDFHMVLLTPGAAFDTVGMKSPAGWRVDGVDARTVIWKTNGNGLTGGQFVEDFRIFVKNLSSSSVRVTWWTTNFGEMICRDTITITCGLLAPDSLFTRPTIINGDSCCQDLLLINSHRPRSTIKNLRLVMLTPNARFFPASSLPSRWTQRSSNAGDSLVFTIDTLLYTRDSVVIPGLCFDNDLAPVDSVRYRWETVNEGMVVTSGIVSLFCRRQIVRCDSIRVQIDSSLSAPQRCVKLRLFNVNSRRDTIRKFTFHIRNLGTPLRIQSVTPPAGWSVENFTQDSVTFHRGQLDPGFSQNDFDFCLNLDTSARNPMVLTFTTWRSAVLPVCTDSVTFNPVIATNCDSLVARENDQSSGSLCCFDAVLYNRNAKGFPVTRLSIRMPNISLIFDTANATGTWRVANPNFPAVSIDYVGDTLMAGDSVKFTYCVNAVAVQRPFTYQLVYTTYNGNSEICFDTIAVRCEGTEGRCDVVEPTRLPSDGNCSVDYAISNQHTPAGPVNNIELNVVTPGVNFTTAEADGTASPFQQISLGARKVIFRGGSIPAGTTAGSFRVGFDSQLQGDVVIQICTFQDDQPICCVFDTITCSISGVEEDASQGEISVSVVPNPFSTSTEFRYHAATPGSVQLRLVDATGREVRNIHQENSGRNDGRLLLSSDGLPSGLYFYELTIGGETRTGRLLVVH